MHKPWLYVAYIFTLTLSDPASMVSCSPMGPPIVACDSMMAKHGVSSSQSTASPYAITMRSNCYMHGQTVEVTISEAASAINSNQSSIITGFFIQARNSNNARHGTWDVNGQNGLQEIHCSGYDKSAAGHSGRGTSTSVSLQWIAPDNGIETLHFRATVVKSKEIFWTEILSSDIVYNDTCLQANKVNRISVSPALMLLVVTNGAIVIWNALYNRANCI